MSILRGMATVNYFAADHEAAKRWYSELLGVEPYFQRPGYAEFRIGDHEAELGIIDAAYAPHDVSTPGGAVLYWAVDDLPATLQRLTSMGAKEHQPIIDRGGQGFVTASVVDPFGNILGIMTNPHYQAILKR